VTSKGTAPVREPSDAELIRRRAAWFHDQRAFPLGFIPAGARLRALEQLKQMLRLQKQQGAQLFAAAPTAGDPPWTPIGPQPTNSLDFRPFTSGRVTALAVDPRDTTGNTVYLGAAQGGVWKTTDGGQTWVALTDSQPSLAVGSIALGPPTPPNTMSTIYVGTGEENFAIDSYYGAGVLKSVDGGTNSTQDSTFKALIPISSTSGGPNIGAIAVSPLAVLNGQILLAALRSTGTSLQSGIWCSQNAGVNWTLVLSGFRGFDVAFGLDGTGYAAIGSLSGGTANGVYRTQKPVANCTDFAAAPPVNSWMQLTSGLPSGTSMGRIALGIAPSTSSIQSSTTLYAAIQDASTISTSDSLLGVFKTTSGGASWIRLTAAPNFCFRQCSYDLAIRVSPTSANLVFAGGSAPGFGPGAATLVRSTDGGGSWADVSNNATTHNGIHVDMHAIAFSTSGTVLYVGNDGGVWSASNPAGTLPLTWNNLNQPLAITQFYPGLSIHPSNPAFRTFGGTQDNGIQEYIGSLAWNDLGVPCDGGFIPMDPLVPVTMYGTCEYIPAQVLVIFRSVFVQNPPTLVQTISGINGNDRGNFIPPLVIDPSNSQRLYFGTCRVWQTVNNGNFWTAISPDLTGSGALDCPTSTQSGGVLATIAVAPSNSNTIYTGSDNAQVFMSTNGGTGWTNVSLGLPPRAVTAIAVDPTNPQTAYATFSGFSGFVDTQGHVFQTTTGGVGGWTDISTSAACAAPAGPLPNIPVNDIVIDPDIAGRLYVATDIGVFQGDLQTVGACWQPLGMTSLPHVAVFSLKLNQASRTLRAATHGRSVWELQLPDSRTFAITSMSPVTANTGDPAFTLTVNGIGFTMMSSVNWNGSPRPTTPVSANQLTAAISSSDLTCGGIPVSVTNPGAPPVTSNSLPFSIPSVPPSASGLMPTSAFANSMVTLTVMGSNFDQCSVVEWNGSPRATTFMSATQLAAQISAQDTAAAGAIPVTVFTPGGGTSGALTFTVVAGDFGIASSPSSATVPAGGKATYTIMITPQNGFNTSVMLSCSNLPTQSFCSFSANPVPPSMPSGSPVSSTLTIQTTARATTVPLGSPHRRPLVYTPWLAWLTLALLFAALARRRALHSKLSLGLATVVLLAWLVPQVACGGGGGGSAPTGTPAGTFMVTVTGTSGSVQHSTTVTLTVQ
jgi:photosystem II stability/assembly factor-like uncharacterized protein